MVNIGGPGRIDPREPIMGAFKENYDDDLINQASVMPYMADNQEYTAGVSGIYFDAKFVFVTSTNFAYHQIGNFSTDYSVGPNMTAVNALHVIPRREEIKSNKIEEDKYFFHDKGYKEIGVAINGVPFYSYVSNQRVAQGKIVRYDVVGTGYGYRNPTLLVNDVPIKETIELDNFGIGRVLSITTNDDTNYDASGDSQLPIVEITGGKDGEIALTFDRYGRCTDATIVNPGQYYNDVPSVQMVDSTFTGKGGNLVCTVKNGQLETVTVLNPGLDYKPATTRCVIQPAGGGAQIAPIVQFYQINRVEEVYNNRYWTFDPGNGFLWENGNYDKIYYGYVCFPPAIGDNLIAPARIATEEAEKVITSPDGDYILATPLGTGANHSPLLGYAYDGNPR